MSETLAIIGHNNPPRDVVVNRRELEIVQRGVKALAALCGFSESDKVLQKRSGLTALSLRQWAAYALTDDNPDRGLLSIAKVAAIFGVNRSTVERDRNAVKCAIMRSGLVAEFVEMVQDLFNLVPGFVDHSQTALAQMRRARAALGKTEPAPAPPKTQAPSRAAQIFTEMGRWDLANRSDDLGDLHALIRRQKEERARQDAWWRERDKKLVAESKTPDREDASDDYWDDFEGTE